jgi:ribosomal protein S18 acetylase RimI-like enzyme
MISPSFRGNGVGRALLRHFVGECRTDKLWTSTNQSNIPMQALLSAEGFQRSGIIENLEEGDPELIYFKPTPDF